MGSIMAKNGNLLYNVFEEWKMKYGKLYAYFMGPRLFVIVENLDTVQEVLIKRFDCFTDRMMSSIVHEKLDVFMKNVAPLAEDQICFDIYEKFKALTLDVIAKCAFDLPSDCQNNCNDPFILHSKNYFNELPSPERSILMRISEQRERRRNQAPARPIHIPNRCGELTFRDNNSSPLRDLGRLLKIDFITSNFSKRKGAILDSRQISNNCFAFLLAGYETTSTSLGFTAWLLAKHQRQQETLFDELNENLRNLVRFSIVQHLCTIQIALRFKLRKQIRAKNDCQLRLLIILQAIRFFQEGDEFYDTVMSLPYLDAVFHEALRMYPPITFFVNRTCTKQCNVDGINFRPGIQVAVPIWNIHRDAKNWPQPNAFRPERFYKRKDYHPMSWLPFGSGPRNCVGVRFAAMEYKLTLARLLLHYRLVFGATSEDPLPLKNSTAMLSTDHVNVCLERRS
ncbi:unnamed protein product [Anisakis simplex]|uniref:Cytochrome P450 n=1 Tax=Anisakis simplex TaxID=6269 RepID=A0A0M3K3K1_ANISI|nr:unnamed protein product [Anisakis simplex]